MEGTLWKELRDALLGEGSSVAKRLEDAEALAVDQLPQHMDWLGTNHHMTLMMAQRHNCSIALEVFQTKFVTTKAGTEAYCREIALKNSFGREVVYALARVHLDLFSPEARADIRAESLPLGRILVKHNVERRLEVDGVYLLEKPSEWLSSRWQVEKDTSLYARTATILCNDQPAIEVLEIIRPEGTR